MMSPTRLYPERSPFILGTAQLGMPYGIANTTGQPDQACAVDIVRAALGCGVDFFDTAQAYGVSEAVLGEALRACGGSEGAQIITKLSPVLPDSFDALLELVHASLQKLGVAMLYCIMLHREEALSLLSGSVGKVLSHCLERGLAKHVGISVYTPDAALQALRHPLIGIVQIPTSLFDRRFEEAGVFALAQELGKELHIRSIFLQGIVCMDPSALPVGLEGLASTLESFRAASAKEGCTQAQGALGWILRRYPKSRIIFGAERPCQVSENLDFARRWDRLSRAYWEALAALRPPQIPELLNPALWPRSL